jgi:hypothetical protein
LSQFGPAKANNEVNEAKRKSASFVGRDVVIDLIRGYCILSMVLGHLASTAYVTKIVHVFPQFDGASGFVLLSGLVLGMVQRRRVEYDGLGAVQKKSARRVMVIYCAQMGIILASFCAVSLGWRHANLPNYELPTRDFWIHSFLMNLAPPGGDVLRLYVVFILIAMGSYWLLVRGRWLLLLLMSCVLNVGSQFYPYFSSFSPLDGQARSAGWAGWQFLFVSSLILGWYWIQLGAREWISRKSALLMVVASGVIVLLGACSFLLPAELAELIFSKYTFPIGRIIMAYAVVCALYVAVNFFLRWVPVKWLRPITVIGQRSLDTYIIQALAVVIVFGFGVLVDSLYLRVALTLVACWGWSEVRLMFSRRKSLRAVARQSV